MDMHSRNEYLKELQGRYFMATSRKEKSSILDEYCKNTHQNRKYVISKIHSFSSSRAIERRKRKQIYDGYVKAALAKLWEIFDYPCGQRLAPPSKSSKIPELRPDFFP
jgi:DNA integrity scanning protein DisA with diadenylate cyclase activity